MLFNAIKLTTLMLIGAAGVYFIGLMIAYLIGLALSIVIPFVFLLVVTRVTRQNIRALWADYRTHKNMKQLIEDKKTRTYAG